MFIKIKDEEILNVEEVKRVLKATEFIYEETEEYKNFKKSSNNSFGIFFGAKYTNVVIETIYKIIIYTNSFDIIEYRYNVDLDYRDKDFDAIWNRIKIFVMIDDDASVKEGE